MLVRIGNFAVPVLECLFHRLLSNIFCVAVLNNFSDPHQQCFLRGHSDYITSMHISSSGRLIASGQQGTNSDVIIWDYESKSIKYRLEEHQFGIDAVKFSRDEVW